MSSDNELKSDHDQIKSGIVDKSKLATLLDEALVGIEEESDEEFNPFKKTEKPSVLSEVLTDGESPQKITSAEHLGFELQKLHIYDPHEPQSAVNMNIGSGVGVKYDEKNASPKSEKFRKIENDISPQRDQMLLDLLVCDDEEIDQ